MKCRDLLKDTAGLTLIELMIVMALSLLLMAAVYLSSQVQSETSNELHQVIAIQQDLRAVIGIVEKDILNAGCDPLFTNSPISTVFGIQGPLASSTTVTVRITSDLNANGVLDAATEQVDYDLAAGELRRNGEPLARNVTNLQFTYQDEDGNATTTIADIRYIIININMLSPNGESARELTRRIKYRNIKA